MCALSDLSLQPWYFRQTSLTGLSANHSPSIQPQRMIKIHQEMRKGPLGDEECRSMSGRQEPVRRRYFAR
jgi:hypothetical protein